MQSPTGMVVFRVARGYSVRGPVSMAAAPPSRGYGVRVADIASPIVGAEPLPLTFVAPEPAALEGKDIIFRLRRVDTIASSGNGTLDIVRFTFSQHQAWNRTWARPDASIAAIASTLERVRLQVVDGDGSILEESQPFRHSSALADPALYPGAALVLGRGNAVNLTVAGGIFENQTMMLSPVLLSTPESTPTTSSNSIAPLGSMWLSAEGEARGVTPTLSHPGSGYVLAVRAFVGGHQRNLTAVAPLFVVDGAREAAAARCPVDRRLITFSLCRVYGRGAVRRHQIHRCDPGGRPSAVPVRDGHHFRWTRPVHQ